MYTETPEPSSRARPQRWRRAIHPRPRGDGTAFPKASIRAQNAAHFAGATARSLRSASAGETGWISGRAALAAALVPRATHRAVYSAGACLSSAGPAVPACGGRSRAWLE